jgi:antitoxin HicB
MTKTLEYKIELEAFDGGFLVSVPSLPGCVTWGETVEEAELMAADAIRAYVESLDLEGEPIPHEKITSSTVSVEVPA